MNEKSPEILAYWSTCDEGDLSHNKTVANNFTTLKVDSYMRTMQIH